MPPRCAMPVTASGDSEAGSRRQSVRMTAFAPTAASAVDERPCIVHVVFRFDTGGLENGLVNLINHMPAGAYRHVVVALTTVTDFRQRVLRDDVLFIALDKPPGHAIGLFPRLYRLFRGLRPAIVHSRNLAALETLAPAWLAGVPVRIHGEHGRDTNDLDGSNRRHQWARRLYRPFVSHYVALSGELSGYLSERIGVPARRISRVCNGVDDRRFHAAADGQPAPIDGCPFDPAAHWLVGSVGRMQAVKNQTLLARGFVQALAERPALRQRLRLVLVGDGPLRAEVAAILAGAGVGDLAWLPGERHDVPEIMRGLNAFALPSLAEGISNTILEAKASALPVVATRVGGNAELVDDGVDGLLVPSGDVQSMAAALVRLADSPAVAAAMGRAGRLAVEQRFSLGAMVATYQSIYDRHSRR